MRSQIAKDVEEFHTVFGHPIAQSPTTDVSPRQADARLSFIEEEVDELAVALGLPVSCDHAGHEDHFAFEEVPDIVEIADALADIVYFVYGTAAVYGIPLDDVLAEVHRSNMTKLGADGKPVYREDGKVLKGPNFERPNIAKVLGL